MKRLLTAACVLALAAMTAYAAETKKSKKKGEPYTLGICVVSGGKLGSMGDPVLYEHEGREIRFCCEGCIGKFKKDSAQYLAKADDFLTRRQSKHYPLKTCLVSGEALGDKPVSLIHDNRLVQFCCKGCVKKFKADPAKHLSTLNDAIIKKEKPKYSFKQCMISNEPFGGDMGDPIDVVVGNRYFKVCCKGCIKSLKKEPTKYLNMLDEKQQK